MFNGCCLDISVAQPLTDHVWYQARLGPSAAYRSPPG